MHAHTLYGSYRPFGSSVIVAAHDIEGYKLYLIDPSGHNYVKNLIQGFYATCAGKGKTVIKNEFEKKDYK